MLAVMNKGDMPDDRTLRVIANANPHAAVEAWNKHKPEKGHTTEWWKMVKALSQDQYSKNNAKFGDDLAKKHGVRWRTDLFAEPGKDIYTNDCPEFLDAQREWLQTTLPTDSAFLTTDSAGYPILPKGAVRTWGGPGPGNITGLYVDPRDGDIETQIYQLPTAAVAPSSKTASNPHNDQPSPSLPTTRPPITHRGQDLIGEIRTAALHTAIAKSEMSDSHLLALMVAAFGSGNVQVHTSTTDRRAIAGDITDWNSLCTDPDVIRAAAKRMLIATLSLRRDHTQSGPLARIAGVSLDADSFIPSLATDEFLTCMSKGALEQAAIDAGLKPSATGRDIRAQLIAAYKDKIFLPEKATFALSSEEATQAKRDHTVWTPRSQTTSAAVNDDNLEDEVEAA